MAFVARSGVHTQRIVGIIDQAMRGVDTALYPQPSSIFGILADVRMPWASLRESRPNSFCFRKQFQQLSPVRRIPEAAGVTNEVEATLVFRRSLSDRPGFDRLASTMVVRCSIY